MTTKLRTTAEQRRQQDLEALGTGTIAKWRQEPPDCLAHDPATLMEQGRYGICAWCLAAKQARDIDTLSKALEERSRWWHGIMHEAVSTWESCQAEPCISDRGMTR